MKGKIAGARASRSWIVGRDFGMSMTTKNDDVFAQCRDARAFGRLTIYDQLAHGTFARVTEECPKEMRVEECAR
jgi:hypothetical protein